MSCSHYEERVEKVELPQLKVNGMAIGEDLLARELQYHPADSYALALEAQTQGDYPAMLAWLRAAAREGHAPAQRMLGIALIGGPALYGAGQPADLCEGRQWLLRAAGQGAGDDVAYALFGRPRDALTAHCEAA